MYIETHKHTRPVFLKNYRCARSTFLSHVFVSLSKKTNKNRLDNNKGGGLSSPMGILTVKLLSASNLSAKDVSGMWYYYECCIVLYWRLEKARVIHMLNWELEDILKSLEQFIEQTTHTGVMCSHSTSLIQCQNRWLYHCLTTTWSPEMIPLDTL